MNNYSRLNRTHTPHELSRNMKSSDLAISKSEENKETVNYSFHYDVCKSKDNSDYQTQSKRLHKSEHDFEVLTPPNKRIKNGQSWTCAETQTLKKSNDNSTYDNEVNDGTDDTPIDVIDESQDYCNTNDSQDDDDTDNSQESDDTNDSNGDYGSDDSQGDDGSDDGHKDGCNEKDEADLLYGTHETQVSECGEADLHKHLVSCMKNPGHVKLVPVCDFNINHLPEGHHDNDLVQFIKTTADLTVRVAVKMTSTRRPEFLPNTTVPYAFYNKRGSDVLRVGTGMVYFVMNFNDAWGTCQCHKCQHSETPGNRFGIVRMCTARHVVFDDLEALHTTCRFFFDRQDSPLVTLDGWKVYVADIKEDWCVLECETCDVDLLDKLDKMERHWRDLCQKVNIKYKHSRDKMTFIVSHPHGCSKQISVGQWINRYVVSEFRTMYTYTTCTCPGSSGACVHSLGYDDWDYRGRHVHRGVNSKGNNFSSFATEMYYRTKNFLFF